MLNPLREPLLNLAVGLFTRSIQRRNGSTDRAAAPLSMMRSVKVNGHRLCYLDVGQGDPIVLLHGLGSSALSWLFVLPELGQRRRVIALDQIGHGRSEKPAIPYRISDFVDYLEAFLKQLSLSQVDLVGNSLGGWVAAHFAIKRPELVRRLALVCSAGLLPSPELQARLQQIHFAPRTFAEMRAMLSACFYDKARFVNQRSVAISYLLRRLENNGDTVMRILDSISNQHEWLDEQLYQVSARTLVLWGREDELLPVEFAKRFATAITNAQLEIFERCGHVPQLERARDFNHLLTEFLD
ncbi:MAG: alpha/beta fold hydrolase [Acidobacteriota bacterium]